MCLADGTHDFIPAAFKKGIYFCGMSLAPLSQTLADFFVKGKFSLFKISGQKFEGAGFTFFRVFFNKGDLKTSDTVFNHNHVVVTEIENQINHQKERKKNNGKKKNTDWKRKEQGFIFYKAGDKGAVLIKIDKGQPVSVLGCGNFFQRRYFFSANLFNQGRSEQILTDKRKTVYIAALIFF